MKFGSRNWYDIWKVQVPVKIKAFVWRCFLNRIPTKYLLAIRGIFPLSSNLDCAFYGVVTESSLHFLLLCVLVDLVWKELASWNVLSDFRADNFKGSYWIWSSFCRSRKVNKRKVGCIWLAIIWSLWIFRNGIIFKNFVWKTRDVVWGCKDLIWKWSFIGNISHTNYNIYEFDKNSLFYLCYYSFGG